MKVQNPKIKSQKFKLVKKILFLGLVLSFLPIFTFSATLYLEPKEETHKLGDHFAVKIRIDPEGECINTIAVDLSFPKNILLVEGINLGDSIINIWVEKPSSLDIKKINEEGKIYFAGGIPGGFCGRIPGDPGSTNIVAEIRFFIPSMIVGEVQEQEAEIKLLETSQVFLNDGRGTQATMNLKSSKIKITPERGGEINEWRQKLLEDTIPPESFEIQIQKDPAIFDGKYFIIFQTTDKETGVDYYMVKEGEREWRVAKNPYLLENQNLDEEIKVKAVDRAGNETIATYYPKFKKTEKPNLTKNPINREKIIIISALISLILILIFILIFFIKKRRKF
jgi:hypothetical protein